MALLDDDFDHGPGADALIGADGRTQRHHRRRPGLFQPSGQHRIGADVGQYHQSAPGEEFDRLQGFDRVGQQITGVGMNFKLDPAESGGFAEARDAYRLLRVACAGGIEHDLDPAAVDGAQDIVVGRVVRVHPGQRGGDQFGLRRFECGLKQCGGGEFAGAEKKTIGKPAAGDYKFFHDVILDA
ncbi:hypothetical protein SDC9_102541 [bioreactor metagenome]|uniref:Uncharacterized protein n=1 Tax=bioreactor metagenome TaxID=1076179 RepID=A0A645B203_9ZZZZ